MGLQRRGMVLTAWLLAASLSGFAQGTISIKDISGKWSVVPRELTGTPSFGGNIEVLHTASMLTIAFYNGKLEKTGTWSCSLDGKQCENKKTPESASTTSTVKVDGDKLVIETKEPSEGFVTTIKRELTIEQGTLVVNTISNNARYNGRTVYKFYGKSS